MSNTTFLNSIRFILLVLLQVLLLNHINFLGYINPYLYILFILWFPVTDNKIPFILLSFLLGITIDFFSDSGAAHAAASVAIAYIRPLYMRLTFGVSYEQVQKLSQTSYGQRIVYVLLMILTHHLILFSLEIFSFANILYIVQKTLYTGAFTFILTIISIALFSKKKK